MAIDKFNLIWIDLEMTGLDCASDSIIEIATIVTDKTLNIIEKGPSLVIHQHDDVLERMDSWNQEHHSASGLLDEVRQSSCNAATAERQTLDFLRQHIYPHTSPMCGNSICQDRRFLARLMPELEKFFHYRNLDVSTFKELIFRWAPDIAYQTDKTTNHRALQDIYGSIEELQYYREHFLRPNLNVNL